MRINGTNYVMGECTLMGQDDAPITNPPADIKTDVVFHRVGLVAAFSGVYFLLTKRPKLGVPLLIGGLLGVGGRWGA